MAILFPAFFTLAFSILFSKVVIVSSQNLRWLIRSPSDDRWHSSATPSMGGIAIFLSFFISVIAFGDELSEATFLVPLFWGSVPIFALGLIDDLQPLPPYVKLVGQIALACLMVMLGIRVPLGQHFSVYFPLTVLWFVGITNALNLLDNMDGLAGGIAFIVSVSLAIQASMGRGW